MVELSCPKCGAAIEEKGINRVRRMARCSGCRTVFRFEGEADAGDNSSVDELPEIPVRPPASLEVAESGNEITVRWKVRSALVGCGLGGIGSLGVLFLVYGTRRSRYGHSYRRRPALAESLSPEMLQGVQFIIGLLAVAALYCLLVYLVNRYTLRVSASELSIRNGPLPWLGHRTVPVRQLAQLYCEDKSTTNRKGGTKHKYQVHALLRDGSRMLLVNNLKEAEQALYLERRIENHLRIRDVAVPGAMRR